MHPGSVGVGQTYLRVISPASSSASISRWVSFNWASSNNSTRNCGSFRGEGARRRGVAETKGWVYNTPTVPLMEYLTDPTQEYVSAGDQPGEAERPAAPTRQGFSLAGGDENPGQGQHQVQGAADQVGDQPGEDQPEMKADRNEGEE